jgi:WD40 repeat protein/serine/threonine protein kinase
MLEQNPCPYGAYLKELLQGTIAEEMQPELSEHLDQCSLCQELLEQIAQGNEPLSEVARQIKGEPAYCESALRRVMRDLKDTDGLCDMNENTAHEDEISLSFLRPPEKPEHLGRLGSYEVTQVIGRGGMGVVLKALDPSLNRYVAVKVLAPQLATSAAARKRFAREARAAAAVNHEHVVAIHAVDEEDGMPYLVMEYIPGLSLQQRLDRTGPLEIKEILRIGMQTASGLAAAHAQGVMHRDIKPANILLENGVERVKITDFGLARTVDDASVTQSGILAGTPQYMAPEQARGEPQDQRVDLFSLGSVLYALCTGRPPFRANTTMAVLRRVSDEEPRPIREVNPEVPEGLVEIINKLHAKDPAYRYQSAAEVAEVLGQYLAHVQQPTLVSVPLSSEAEPSQLRRRGWIRDRRWATAAAALLLVAGGLGVTEATGQTEIRKYVATVLRIKTADGILNLRVEDPDVKVSLDGDEVVISEAGLCEIRLRPGAHKLKAVGKDGKTVKDEVVTISRDDRKMVTITREAQEQPVTATQAGLRALAIVPEVGLPVPMTSTHSGPLDPRFANAPTRLGEMEKELVRLQSLVRSLQSEKHAQMGPGVGVGDIPLPPKSFGAGGAGWNPTQPLKLIEGDLSSLAFSPDGRTLAISAGSKDSSGSVVLYEWPSLRIKAKADEAKAILSLAFSPDGKILASGESDHSAKLRDAVTGKLLKELRVAGTPVHSVAFSPDGKRIATASEDREVRVWDVTTGQNVLVMGGDHIDVPVVAFSPDGQSIAFGGSRHTLHLFSTKDGNTEVQLSGHSGPIKCVSFAPDGKILATGSGDKTVRLWDVATGKEIRRLSGHLMPVVSLAFSPNGELLASVSGGKINVEPAPEMGELIIWSMPSGKQLIKMHPTAGSLSAVAFSPDGKTLTAGSLYGVVMLWRTALPGPGYMSGSGLNAPVGVIGNTQGDKEQRLKLLTDEINALKEEIRALRGGQPSSNSRTLEPARQLAGHSDVVSSVAYSSAARLLVSAGGDQTVRLWDVASGKQVRQLTGHTEGVKAAVFSPDGRLIVSGGKDDTIRVWDVASGRIVRGLSGQFRWVWSIAVSPDGRLIASGNGDNTARLWDLETGRELHRLVGHTDQVHSVAFSPDGKLLASGGFDETIRLWDVATGKEYRGFGRDQGWGLNWAISVAFSPDGKRIISGHGDGSVRIWDVATGREVMRFQGHGAKVESVAFSLDGRYAISGSYDNTGRLWDTGSGRCVAVLSGHTNHVTGVAFSPDGLSAASCGDDNMILIWRLGEVINKAARGH